MMNPEFRRNLWLSFSTHRLIAMPALLGLTFFALAYSDRASAAEDVYHAAIALFIFIVWLWGARNANSAIVDELRDKTWDQQRMSALGPWEMTWGKLFGATAFNWYGGAICLAALLISGFISDQPDWLLNGAGLVAVGILIHAALIALNLHTGQLEIRLIQRGGMGWLAIVFAFMLLQNIIVMLSVHPEPYSWWFGIYDNKPFLLGSVLLFMACAVFGAWRIMSNALQVRTTPWAWPAFALLLTGYFAGFSDHITDDTVLTLALTGLVVSLLLSYLTLFTEPNSLLIWNKLRLRQQAQDWRGWLEHLPLWPTTLLLAFSFALLATFSQNGDLDSDGGMPALLRHLPLTLALMLLRDAAILLFFAFAPNARRPVAVALLYLVVLNLLLPFLCKMIGLDPLANFFLPFAADLDARSSLAIMTLHAALALGLVAWRLGRPSQAA